MGDVPLLILVARFCRGGGTDAEAIYSRWPEQWPRRWFGD